MRVERGLFVISLFFLILMPLVQADVISVNSGGTGNVILNPDKYIEGFFFGEPGPAGPICGNSVIETGEQCDDGNTASGDGCSATCQTETVTPPTGGGGGGGGGAPTSNITVTPEEFNVDLAINTNIERTISVTNTGSNTQTISISQSNLNNNVILGNTSLTLAAGETKTFNVIFVGGSNPGVVSGTIFVGGQQVLVSLNIQSELLLFDSNIVVLNDDFEVEQGSDLKTLVTLIPFGNNPRLDVTLNFEIKDYQGNTYLTKSESILVTKQTDLRRNFDTGNIPLGDYVIALELIYPNGVAPSSAHFEVVEAKGLGLFGIIVLILILLILIILIIITIIQIKRRLDERKQQTGSYFS